MLPEVSIRLLRAPGEGREGGIADRERDARLGGGGRIRCPRCRWEPERGDRWSCVCGHLWNTFETGGVCPECQRRWKETQCQRCLGWSPHPHWYESEGEPPA